MPVTPGDRIGPYEVIELVGAGGMGQVYRARDVRLGRNVAIKFLHAPFALHPARRTRFDREARLLASLNHPNIATVYSVEESADGQVLAMEFVEGHTLHDYLALHRGTAGVSVREVVVITRQIAAALEAAHSHGIIHRDLKPANVIVGHNDTVKVLDFGLAKTLDHVDMSLDASTVAGINDKLLEVAGPGTPPYMSPEQVRGLPLDKRTDIWSFGCIVYELLTGARAFDGDNVSDVVARILEREPDYSLLPADTPPVVARLIRRCLQKRPQDRLRDIGDALLELEDTAKSPQSPVVAISRATRWSKLLPVTIAAVLFVVAVALFTSARQRDSRPIIRYSVPANIGTGVGAWFVAISPDGSRLAYVSPRGIAVRSRDRLDAQLLLELPGGAPQAPFFSPDGQWLAYGDGQSLYKISTNGGGPVRIGDVGAAPVATWSSEGIIVASTDGLFLLPPDGAKPKRIPIPSTGAAEQLSYPELLPGGHAVLFTVLPAHAAIFSTVVVNAPDVRIDVFDLDTRTRKTLINGASRGHLLPTGHLVYAAAGSLYATQFDRKRLALRGPAVQVLSGASNLDFAVADDGTLVYYSGGNVDLKRLAWVDRHGREELIDAPPRAYKYPRLSPDGRRIALDIVGPIDRDIWIWDLRRRVLERFTVDPAGNPLVAWSPDGKTLAFGSDRFGPTQLFLQPADRSSSPQRLLEADHIQMPINFTPDGRLLFSEELPNRGRDIQVLSLDGSRRVETLVSSPGQDTNAEVSPDGRWLAYDTDESGQMEVYVRPYRSGDQRRWQVSTAGGRQPLWSRDGRELFYRDFSGDILSLRVDDTADFSAGAPNKIVDGSHYFGSGRFMSARTYDISPDGRRFLVIKSSDSAEPGSFVVVVNWFDELRRLLPAP